VGGYLQWAQAEGDDDPGTDELRAGELGVSYRTSTRVRLYGAYYYVDFRDEGGNGALTDTRGGIFLIGLRAAL
jgi:predicted porin